MTAAADDRLISRHRTANTTGSIPLTARALAAEPEAAGQVEPLGPAWLTVAVIIGVMAALIALGGMILSFRAVSAEMVPAFGARWAWLVPIVVDLTVFVFSGVDLVLARLDMSHPLARWTVYGATGGTVWLNYSAGGSAAGRVAHVLMPSIWVVFIELMRHVVRRQVNLATASHREPIPTTRWLLSPWPTLKLWRRMVLWRINSYPRALEQEKMRLGAVAAAREMYGRFWRLRISPLTKLQINLGELGAHDLLPAGGVSVDVGVGAGAFAAGTPMPMPEPDPGDQAAPAVAATNGHAPAAHGVDVAADVVPAGAAAGAERGTWQAPSADGEESLPVEAVLPRAPVPADAVRAVPSAASVQAPNGARLAATVAAAAPGPPPNTPVQSRPSGPGAQVPASGAGVQPRPSEPDAPSRHAAPHPVSGLQANGPQRPRTPQASQYPVPGGGEPIPGVAAAGAAAGAVARGGIPPQISGAVFPTAPASAPVPAQRAAHAAPPAVPLRRQDPPHIEFQAPPPMPPMPRRSTRESELLTAAREVERWRGLPSATRISRELGIGMPLATSLANALREEEGPGQDEGELAP